VRRHLVDIAVLAAACAIAGTVLALAEPGWRDVVIRVCVFVVGGLVMLTLIAAAGDAVPSFRRSQLEAALTEREPSEPGLHELERLQREVTLARVASFDLHHRLLPQLRQIADARLERAGRVAGPDTLGRWWDLLRPDRRPPDDRFAPGIASDELRDLVRDLERIG
jgi:uncharacterized protein (DUF1501 family)